MRSKKPVIETREPLYKALEQSDGIPRRSFVGLVGRAALLGVLGRAPSGCFETGLRDGRIPLEGSRACFTSDYGDLSYVVHTEHLFERFGEFLRVYEVEILESMDRLFLESYSVDELSSDEGKRDAEKDLEELLRERYRALGQGDAGIVALELEIVRLKKNETLDGGIERALNGR